MANITDNQKTEGLNDTSSYRVQPTVITTSNITTTLTVLSNSYIIFIGSTVGQVLKLGAATTYLTGHTYLLHNNASIPVVVLDGANTALLTLEPNQRSTGLLQDNTTTAGIWLFNSTTTDLANVIGTLVSTSRFSDLDQTDFHQHHIFHFLDVIINGGVVTNDNGTPTDNSYMGLVSCATGITSNSNGKAVLDGNTSVNNIKVSNMSNEWRVRLPILSTGTIGYQVRIGIQDANTAGDPANGIYFVYSENINGGQWRGTTTNSSTSTNIDSTIAPAAATWYKLRWVCNTTSVSFYVNNILIGTSTTNIPTGNATRLMAKIEKKSPNATTSRSVEIDWVSLGISR